MRNLLCFIVLFCVLFLMGSIVLWPWYTYYIDQSEVSFAWDPNPVEQNVSKYEVKICCIETQQEWSKEVIQPPVIFTYKRSGHFSVHVRAFNGNWSDWTNSNGENAIVIINGEILNKPWCLYWRMPKPVINFDN